MLRFFPCIRAFFTQKTACKLNVNTPRRPSENCVFRRPLSILYPLHFQTACIIRGRLKTGNT
ncbi:hypothetical protein HMPREF9123_1985 [Neisseria bacilliformis ATCC BAA-1200]|uniref:Uncharacterized protein n=1 Tax=Neisseria bacilliformis ATCC BAA-1200 TaxID=888742 RepID=F2BE29_9NEIS|nr:hypothetical protein HMPREF9123_1985 [Neisseria bacilliformis ATCC BAA-1200]